MTRKNFVTRTLSVAIVLVMSMAFCLSGSIARKNTVIAASGSGLEQIAIEWADQISSEILDKSEDVLVWEGGFLDSHRGDIRQLGVETVMSNVFNVTSSKLHTDNGERMYTFSTNGWDIDYSMTRAYGSYMKFATAVHNDEFGGGFWIFTNDENVVEFHVMIDNSGISDVPCAKVDLDQLFKDSGRPVYPQTIIISEGSYVASPMELALIGLLSKCTSESSLVSTMSESELQQSRTYYTNLCNNQKACASRAAEVIDDMLDSGKDIRDIRVTDVLNAMSANSYSFHLTGLDPDDFSCTVDGSENVAEFHLDYSAYQSYYEPSEITLKGKYKHTGKAFQMSVKPTIQNNSYVIETTFGSVNDLGGTTLERDSFVLNERNFNNYHIYLDEGDQCIDCAMIGQLYGVLVHSSF